MCLPADPDWQCPTTAETAHNPHLSLQLLSLVNLSVKLVLQSTGEFTRDELKKSVKLGWTDKAKAEIAAAKGGSSTGGNTGGNTGGSQNTGGNTSGNTGGDNGGGSGSGGFESGGD